MSPITTQLISGECTIYGYGFQDLETKETSTELLAGKLEIVSLDECRRELGPYVAPDYDSGMICAVGEGVDACQVTFSDVHILFTAQKLF